MKDEEMAKEWVDKEISLGTSMYNPQIEYYCKQAFLAGLKAGSQLDKVWHDYDAGEDCYEDSHEGRWVKRDRKLTNAKEIIKELLDAQSCLDPYRDIFKDRILKAEQFLKEIEK